MRSFRASVIGFGLFTGLLNSALTSQANTETASPEVATSAFTHHEELGEQTLYGIGVSANIPHPIFGTLEMKPSSQFSFALGAGGFSYSSEASGSKDMSGSGVGILGIDARGRWHPFGGAFFLGAIVGYQNVRLFGNSYDMVASQKVDYNMAVNFRSFYLTPHLGWHWGFSKGLFIGMELGAQIPMTNWMNIVMSSSDPTQDLLLKQMAKYMENEKSLKNAGDKFGSYILPYITFLKLGYMF